MRPQPLPARSLWARPWAMLALCLAVFYAPMLLAAGHVMTTWDGDAMGHLCSSLGDARPGGRFFHYFDLAANARLWGDDIKYHSFHLMRLLSMALGARHAGWGALVVAVHGALFLAVYAYSRRVVRVSAAAALTGALVAFFSVAWYEWTALVYWTAGAVLLIVSVGEYWRFLADGRRAHLVRCIAANALQAYVTQSQALVPTQAYLLGAVLLMAAHRRRWRDAVLPLVGIVWPLTVLGWTPILAPLAFNVGSGLAARGGAAASGWGLTLAPVTEFLGLLAPVPHAVPILFDKLGWTARAQPPHQALFSSLLFLPSLLALLRVGRPGHRRLAAGVAAYFGTIWLADAVRAPSTLITDIGFHRLFALPALSGFVVAAAADLRAPDGEETRATRVLHLGYRLAVGGILLGLAAAALIGERRALAFGMARGWVGSGVEVAHLFHGLVGWAVGLLLGLAGYLYITGRRAWAPAGWRASALGQAALLLAVAAPVLGAGYAQRWYVRQPALNAMVALPPEFRWLRERIPQYQYRVGIVLASELRLASGDRPGFLAVWGDERERVLAYLREHAIPLRQGLAYAVPTLHFYTPALRRVRAAGNPVVQHQNRPEEAVLARRNVITNPGAGAFDDYGVRYWLSTEDLARRDPARFARVADGAYAAVFENLRAKPVAYLVEQPAIPLPMAHAAYGVRVDLPAPQPGTLSVALDLRRMHARILGRGGRLTPAALEPAGLRWTVRVPPGSAAVVFTPDEAGFLKALAAAAAAAFAVLLAAVAMWPSAAARGQAPALAPAEPVSLAG